MDPAPQDVCVDSILAFGVFGAAPLFGAGQGVTPTGQTLEALICGTAALGGLSFIVLMQFLGQMVAIFEAVPYAQFHRRTLQKQIPIQM